MDWVVLTDNEYRLLIRLKMVNIKRTVVYQMVKSFFRSFKKIEEKFPSTILKEISESFCSLKPFGEIGAQESHFSPQVVNCMSRCLLLH
jgi:hypothetical protein